MVDVRIDAPNIEYVKKLLGKMARRGDNLKPVLKRLGVSLEGIVDRNFEAEGRPVKWKKRSPISQATLSTKEQYKAVWTKAYQNRKTKGKATIMRKAALKGMGNKILSSEFSDLKKSIFSVADDKSVRIGAPKSIKYARIHQLGGIIRPKHAKALFVPCGNRILRLKKVTIPARPYLIVPRSEMPGLTRVALAAFKKEVTEGVKF